MASSINYQAGGTIKVSRFVMANAPIDYQVVQADGSLPIIGIAQPGTKAPPGLIGSSPSDTAAASGDIIAVFQDEANDDVLLYLGATVTGGQLLKSDANGLGTPLLASSTTYQYCGAEARQSGASGDLIRVRPRINAVGRMA